MLLSLYVAVVALLLLLLLPPLLLPVAVFVAIAAVVYHDTLSPAARLTAAACARPWTESPPGGSSSVPNARSSVYVPAASQETDPVVPGSRTGYLNGQAGENGGLKDRNDCAPLPRWCCWPERPGTR